MSLLLFDVVRGFAIYNDACVVFGLELGVNAADVGRPKSIAEIALKF